MKHIMETMMLAVTGFIIFLITIVYHITVIHLRPTMMGLYNDSGIAGKASPIFNQIIIFGYCACLVFFIGAIILYLVESHQEEYETYEEKMNQENQFLR